MTLLISEILFVFEHLFGDNTVAIKTNGTTILGQKLYTVFEYKPYGAFWNVPYAEPPIGELRFKVCTYS